MNSSTHHLLVFDWDGTLLNSTQAIISALQKTAQDFALPVPDNNAASYVIGMGFREALEIAMPALSAQDHAAFLARYREYYWQLQQHPVLFEGATELLAELVKAGYLLAIATGTSRAGLNRALKANGLTEIFHATRCAEESFAKPHPAMLHELIDELGIQKENTLMIGDTTHDLQMAKNAGVKAIGVSYGAHSIDQLHSQEPAHIVHSIAELRNYFNDYLKSI